MSSAFRILSRPASPSPPRPPILRTDASRHTPRQATNSSQHPHSRVTPLYSKKRVCAHEEDRANVSTSLSRAPSSCRAAPWSLQGSPRPGIRRIGRRAHLERAMEREREQRCGYSKYSHLHRRLYRVPSTFLCAFRSLHPPPP